MAALAPAVEEATAQSSSLRWSKWTRPAGAMRGSGPERLLCAGCARHGSAPSMARLVKPLERLVRLGSAIMDRHRSL